MYATLLALTFGAPADAEMEKARAAVAVALAAQSTVAPANHCPCGPGCTCPPGMCPAGCPVVKLPPVEIPAYQRVVIPAGYHAHVTVDGETIIHSDKSHGNAAAHAGVPKPWIPTAVAGQTVLVKATGMSPVVANPTVAPAAPITYTLPSSQGGCPGGICNAPQRVGPLGRIR